MRLYLGPILCSICISILASCSSAATAPKKTMRSTSADIMDTSTWDFGEVDVNSAQYGMQYQQNQQQQEDQFAIVIATFAGDEHAQSAAATHAQLRGQYPMIGGNLTQRPRSRGTALTYGNYLGYDDPAAKKDMAMLRSVPTLHGTPMFQQVLLLRFKASRMLQNLHPHDLWTVRREFPKIVPIFTLEVAVWGDFDSGQFPTTKRRAAAEGYASELRAKGFEAFFYHNDDAELSSVTVGLFGHSAVDAETGFYSYEVEALLSRFPVRLVNGQEVQVYFDPGNPALGSTVQPPCLAEVPVG